MRVAVPSSPARKPLTLVEARRGFRTKLTADQAAAGPLPEPPGKVFRLIRYDSPAGRLTAYLSPDPGDGRKKPAIIRITGGDCNSIGELWEDRPRENDQTAAAYRKAGIIMMFPSLRGGNDNPGRREGFFGEVDDILAATDYVAGLDYVDPGRIDLGGHSTGARWQCSSPNPVIASQPSSPSARLTMSVVMARSFFHSTRLMLSSSFPESLPLLPVRA